MVRDEDAPYDAFKRFREHVRVNRPSYYGGNPSGGNLERLYEEVGQILECNWCLSVWCGLFVAIVTKTNPIYALAYSAGSLFITFWHDQSWSVWIRDIKNRYTGLRR